MDKRCSVAESFYTLPISLSNATSVSCRAEVLEPIKKSINEGDEPDKAAASGTKEKKNLL